MHYTTIFNDRQPPNYQYLVCKRVQTDLELHLNSNLRNPPCKGRAFLKKKQHPVMRIPPTIFKQIERYMPFSSVDIIIFFENEKILLTKRTVRPYFGYWHLPGSMILKKETMTETANRCASEELNIEIDDLEFLGIYELFTDARHYITHTFSARYKRGTIKLDYQSSKFVTADIKDLPEPIIPIQKQMIKDLLKKKKMIG